MPKQQPLSMTKNLISEVVAHFLNPTGYLEQ
ncbi:hypothetical protein C8J43_1047 [Sphingomonas sp. PP-CE-1G-424]|nr:hypothetical protein C8J43_1047 [Sphingomonas sp. PP-CE-1G-424]